MRDLYPEDKLVIIAACGKLKLELDLLLLVPFSLIKAEKEIDCVRNYQHEGKC